MTQVEGCCKDVQGCYKDITRMLQECYKLPGFGCYNDVIRNIKVFVEMLNKYWSDAPQYFADIAGLMCMYMQ